MATALVVDDSAVDRKLIGGLIQQQTNCDVEYASNGKEALAKIQHGKVDIVLTDLQMPEMDGLNLVQAVRLQYTDLPVILITGKGSEELAAEALEQGAASYVPKSQLAQILPETIDDVLAMVRADRSYSSLIDCMTRNEFTFQLSSDLQLIDPLVDLVQQMVSALGLCDAIGRVRVGIALEQALLNALLHGNLHLSAEQVQKSREAHQRGEGIDPVQQRLAVSPYRDRRIFVDIQITADEARFVIQDEGNGFDTSKLPAVGDPVALEREGSRGLVLIRTFMDEVSFNDSGNEITMVKRSVRSRTG